MIADPSIGGSIGREAAYTSQQYPQTLFSLGDPTGVGRTEWKSETYPLLSVNFVTAKYYISPFGVGRQCRLACPDLYVSEIYSSGLRRWNTIMHSDDVEIRPLRPSNVAHFLCDSFLIVGTDHLLLLTSWPLTARRRSRSLLPPTVFYLDTYAYTTPALVKYDLCFQPE